MSLIIFDFDGTLADTIPAISAAVNAALTELGYPARDGEHIRRSVGDGARTLCRRVLPDKLYDDKAALDRLAEVYHNAAAKYFDITEKPYDGFYEVTDELIRRGHTLAVYSNKPDVFVKELVAKLFPDGRFALARGALSGVPVKPAPDGIFDICRTLGFSTDDTTMVGDGDTDVAVAKNAGIKCVSVTWGFRTRAELEAVGGKQFANTPYDLLDYFK